MSSPLVGLEALESFHQPGGPLLAHRLQHLFALGRQEEADTAAVCCTSALDQARRFEPDEMT